MSVGRSGYSSGSSQRSSFIVSVDLTKLPINGTYEIMEAFFTLNTKSTSYDEVWMSASVLNTAFDGNANWNNATNSTQWNSPGAYHSSDTDIPLGTGLVASSNATHHGDITGMLQRAVANGLTTLDFLVQAEENNSNVDGRIDFYSSNEASAALRPSLNITYRMTHAYVDSSPTGLLPVDATTVWNYSSPRPSGADHVNLSWTPPSNNETGFYICSASDARMVYDLNCGAVDS
ncbi:MAG: DNRLRE domain-containing protein, partial [Candidatus Thermoplasmatota archaeon]|nr:DNRLRE domain-containing protein [Candidatus Thermoplasmatota archaeon]